tara:strand:+ start:179 stop:595 length:417 start_codon:yes stop_codon:yes gene_type:complete
MLKKGRRSESLCFDRFSRYLTSKSKIIKLIIEKKAKKTIYQWGLLDNGMMEMADIVIYTRPGCGYCSMAKQLLNAKGNEFTEYNIWSKDEYRAEMIKRSGGASTVPQIFINDDHIGGSDDLYALDRAGHLDGLLSQSD